MNYLTMNELSVIGSLCFRKDFWDHHRANIATRSEEVYGVRLLRLQKAILERDRIFFAAVLS